MQIIRYIALFLIAALATTSTLVAQETYNILWLTVEDMSPRLNCYGDSTVPTPNIDRLAREGVRYTQAFGVYGVCAPNRHTLITGMYPSSTGAGAMRTWKRTSALSEITDPELLSIPVYEATPPAGVKCFSEYLQAAGYYTTNSQKTDYQFRAPVTAWNESSKEAHWRNRPEKDMPFFAVFNNGTPHESGTFAQRSPRVTNPGKIEVPPYYPDKPVIREVMAWHYDNIYAMDQWVGEMMDQLEADGLLDNTIVMFFSDHGDGLPRAKRWVYDAGIKVPLIVRWPDGREAGTVNDELISFIDFAPTVLSLAGLEVPHYMEGQIFLGEKKAAPRDYVYAFRDRMDPAPETIRAVRDHRYKYIRNYRPDLPYIGFIPYRDRSPLMQEMLKLMKEGALGPEQWQFWAKNKPLEELYDTRTDPHEIHNLAADPQFFDKMAELRKAHDAFLREHGDLRLIPESELIRKLWPPDGEQPQTAAPEIQVDGRTVTINSETEGASIGYRLNENEQWQLYTGPFQVKKGTTIEALAHRIGWKESERVVREVK